MRMELTTEFLENGPYAASRFQSALRPLNPSRHTPRTERGFMGEWEMRILGVKVIDVMVPDPGPDPWRRPIGGSACGGSALESLPGNMANPNERMYRGLI